MGAVAVVVVVGTACSSSPPTKSSASTTATTTTVAPAPTTTAGPPTAALTKRSAVSPIYSQGLAHVADGWIFSGTRWLAHTDSGLHQTAINSHAIPAAWLARGYDHIGDIDVIGNTIYAPFEEPNYALGHQATATYNAQTLQFESAVVLPQHQNSFVTIDPRTMIAYSMDEFGGRALLRYDVRNRWKPLAPLAMSRFVDKVQGADIADGAVWLSTDDAAKRLYRVDLVTGAVDPLASQGFTKGGEGEGIDATALPSGLLHALIVPPTLAPVYLQDYSVTLGGR
jgi:hypothetical protein